jgi:hypothetical protein
MSFDVSELERTGGGAIARDPAGSLVVTPATAAVIFAT